MIVIGLPNLYKIIFKRVGGIEPPSLAWKAKVLPLNYTRVVYSIVVYRVNQYIT